MALEMKVYKDIHAYEAKAFAGLTFRQLGCVTVGGALALACFFGVTWFYLYQAGWSWQGWASFFQPDPQTAELFSTSTTIALFPTAAIFVPFAIYGWVRPKGLKPERFIPYWYSYQVSSKELCYGYDAEHRPAGDDAMGTAARPRTRGRAKAQKRKAPSEH
ncbi:hypothetical protein DN539_31250 [Burkholderia multivorans]|uniref:PrgI family protein n=3 Tax=Burkholderia multivorans TaxID=87883 RepID=UPI000DAD549D|nr:hypothetical protein DN539_31250 [Burkholderia multivorans]